MKVEDRKAAIAAYKERKQVAGIYSVRAEVSGEIWVGATTSLDTVQNRLWFTLRHNSNPQQSVRAEWAALQAAWDALGPGALSLETLEIVGEKALAPGGQGYLRKRLAHWANKLAARRI